MQPQNLISRTRKIHKPATSRDITRFEMKIGLFLKCGRYIYGADTRNGNWKTTSARVTCKNCLKVLKKEQREKSQ